MKDSGLQLAQEWLSDLQSTGTPEEMLLVSIISRALGDLSSKESHVRRTAVEWLMGYESGGETHFTLMDCVNYLNLPQGLVRTLRRVAQGELPEIQRRFQNHSIRRARVACGQKPGKRGRPPVV